MVNQKPHNIEEQIRLLRDKGMNFSDDEERKAKECFSRISYFRLKYYWRDLLEQIQMEISLKEPPLVMLSGGMISTISYASSFLTQ